MRLMTHVTRKTWKSRTEPLALLALGVDLATIAVVDMDLVFLGPLRSDVVLESGLFVGTT